MGWKDSARQRATELKEGDTFKLVEGENCFRVMPNKAGADKPPYVEFRVHRNVGPDRAFVRCGKKVNGVDGECWLCDTKIPELLKSSQRQAMADDIASDLQLLVQVSKFKPDTAKFGPPKPWWISAKSLCTAMLSLLSSSRRSYEDPVKGYNMNCTRTGEGLKTRYPGSLQADEEPSVVPKQVLALTKPFSELVPKYSETEQKAAFFGKKAEDIAEEEAAVEEATEEEEEESLAESPEEEFDSDMPPNDTEDPGPGDESDPGSFDELEEEEATPKQIKPKQKKPPAKKPAAAKKPVHKGKR